jgi:hypothetical protein
MSRGHKSGHHEEMSETLAMLALGDAGAPLADDQFNGVVPGSENPQVTAISPSYTPTGSGRLLVIAMISGSDGTVDDPISLQIYRNPTSTTGAPGGVALGSDPETSSSHVGGLFYGILSFYETRPVGTAVTYGISATSLAAHNLTGTVASFTIIELPASL